MQDPVHSRAFKIPDFRVLFLSRGFSTMALQAQAVIVGWHIYELSHDPLYLGLIGLAEAVPAIGFAFLAGHVVDNRKPAQIFTLSTWVLALNTFLIWSSVVMPWSPAIRLIVLFLGVFFSGAVRAFSRPASFALTSHVVPRSLMAEASALNTWIFQMGQIIGPALGGLLYGAVGADLAFGFPSALMILAISVQFFLSEPTRQMRSVSDREAFLTSVASGVRFAFKQKILLSTMMLDMFSVFFGGAVAILPMFSDQILHAGSLGLGILRAAPSVGSGLVAILLVFKPMRTISGRLLLFMVGCFGICILGFGVSNHFALAFLFLALSGVFDGISMVIRQTILQLMTPANMRGRISSLSSIFITSSNEIGAFESGVAAKLLGLVPSILFGGGMTLLVVSVTAWLSPELRHTSIKPDQEP